MYGCVIKIAPYTLGGTPAEDNRVFITSGGLYNELLARNFEPDVQTLAFTQAYNSTS